MKWLIIILIIFVVYTLFEKDNVSSDICTQLKYSLNDNTTDLIFMDGDYCILDDGNENQSTMLIDISSLSQEIKVIIKTNISDDVCKDFSDIFYNVSMIQRLTISYNCEETK